MSTEQGTKQQHKENENHTVVLKVKAVPLKMGNRCRSSLLKIQILSLVLNLLEARVFHLCFNYQLVQ